MTRTRRLQLAAVILCGGITAYGAIRASFFFLTDFALWTGWPTGHAYLLPLCIDALGATGFIIYGITRDRFNLWVGIGAISASMLGNAASHWFTTGKLEPSWISITLSGFVPAISIGLIVHLVTRWLNGPSVAPTPSRTRGTAAVSSPTSGASSTATKPKTSTSKPTTGGANGATPAAGTGPYSTWTLQQLKDRTLEDVVEKARELGLENSSARALVGPLRVNRNRATKIYAQLTNGHG